VCFFVLWLALQLQHVSQEIRSDMKSMAETLLSNQQMLLSSQRLEGHAQHSQALFHENKIPLLQDQLACEPFTGCGAPPQPAVLDVEDQTKPPLGVQSGQSAEVGLVRQEKQNEDLKRVISPQHYHQQPQNKNEQHSHHSQQHNRRKKMNQNQKEQLLRPDTQETKPEPSPLRASQIRQISHLYSTSSTHSLQKIECEETQQQTAGAADKRRQQQQQQQQHDMQQSLSSPLRIKGLKPQLLDLSSLTSSVFVSSRYYLHIVCHI
jgi:hypothetical protein